MVELIYFKHRLVLECLILLRYLTCERVWRLEAVQKGLGLPERRWGRARSMAQW